VAERADVGHSGVLDHMPAFSGDLFQVADLFQSATGLAGEPCSGPGQAVFQAAVTNGLWFRCSTGLVRHGSEVRGASTFPVPVGGFGLQRLDSVVQLSPPHGAKRFRLNRGGGMDTHLQFQADLMYGVHDHS